MLELLFYVELSCEDSVAMLERIKAHEILDDTMKSELVVTIKEATPHCPWDAND